MSQLQVDARSSLQSFRFKKQLTPGSVGRSSGSAPLSQTSNTPAKQEKTLTASDFQTPKSAPCLAHAKSPSSASSVDGDDGSANRKKRRKSAPSAKEENFEEDLAGLPERLGDKPLRMIIIGTNPSGHAWRSGHYYSNPSNHMWRILRAADISPPHIRGPQDDVLMPEDAGVGFLDVGCGNPGTHLSKFTSKTMQSWASAFYERLKSHSNRASASLGCTCGQCGEPLVVAFAGKRQWMELLNIGKAGKAKLTKIDGGVQTLRPSGWPYSGKTEVWVMPSTSGAAPMTIAERYDPYKLLGAHLKTLSWPRSVLSLCTKSVKAEAQ